MSTLTPLETAIIRTLAYFDVFDYPLTPDELWRWLYPSGGTTIAAEQSDVAAALDRPELQTMIERQGEYIFLRGRAATVASRAARKQLSKKKWRRALSGARWLELVPFVKLVAVTNTVAVNNARADSDIDFLIITSPDRIWLARLMVTGIISMLGYRRHGTNIRDRICLSFYATTAAMNFAALRLRPDDPHLAFWTSQVVPLIDDGGTYEKFQRANSWVNERLPNAWRWDWSARLLPPQSGLRAIKRFFETAFSQPIGDILEDLARDRQLKKMAKNTASKAEEGTSEVIISDEMLKFHEDDRRARYNEQFFKTLRRLGIELPAATTPARVRP